MGFMNSSGHELAQCHLKQWQNTCDKLLQHFHIEDGTLQITNKYVWLWWCLMMAVWNACSVQKGEVRSVEEWEEGRGLSLRVKRDEREGVWWLDGMGVSVMAWCQTLCHCQCQPRQPIPQWSATVQCVSKPLCCQLSHWLGWASSMVTHFNQNVLDKGMGSCHDISTFNKGKTFYQGEKGEKSNCFQ